MLLSCFNSNMVRLKDNLRHLYNLVWTEFQFQYGTIKSLEDSMIKIEIPMFQFQYGTIKSLNVNMIAPKNKVSIPIWYD